MVSLESNLYMYKLLNIWKLNAYFMKIRKLAGVKKNT